MVEQLARLTVICEQETVLTMAIAMGRVLVLPGLSHISFERIVEMSQKIHS